MRNVPSLLYKSFCIPGIIITSIEIISSSNFGLTSHPPAFLFLPIQAVTETQPIDPSRYHWELLPDQGSSQHWLSVCGAVWNAIPVALLSMTLLKSAPIWPNTSFVSNFIYLFWMMWRYTTYSSCWHKYYNLRQRVMLRRDHTAKTFTLRRRPLVSTRCIYTYFILHCTCQKTDYMRHLEADWVKSLSHIMQCDYNGYCKGTGPCPNMPGTFSTISMTTTKTPIRLSRGESGSPASVTLLGMTISIYWQNTTYNCEWTVGTTKACTYHDYCLV